MEEKSKDKIKILPDEINIPTHQATKTFDVSYPNGDIGRITIKRMGYKEKNDFRNETTITKIETNDEGKRVPVMVLKPFIAQTLALKKCVVKAPFKLDDNGLDSLDSEVGERIYKEIEEFNNLGDKKK